MAGYNCPDNVSASDPEAPWNKEEVIEEDVYRFREFYVPARMMGAIDRYIKKGIPPGDFLTAVICNDLAESVARADDENMANLPAYVAYFYNELPGTCWGSREKMKAWVEKFKEPHCEICGEATQLVGISLGHRVPMCERCQEAES